MRALSGIQPSGKLHLGNYFGMMKPAIALQEKGETFYFIADYHALTTSKDPAALRLSVEDVVLDFIACGLDPERTVFYRQSDVPEVHELAWLLSIVTPVALLERCHSYKDKIAKGFPPVHGLFAYPVLMAADILGVQADVVPVGHDQKQHVEVTRDIAIKFNLRFGAVFKVPEPLIRETVAVVPGLNGQKMSKSYNNTIEIFGSYEKVRKSVMRIVTDSKTVQDQKDPETCNVFALYRLFASEPERDALAKRYRAGGVGYGEVKQALADLICKYFEQFRQKRVELEQRTEWIDRVLKQGAQRAKSEIGGTLKAARRAVGLE